MKQNWPLTLLIMLAVSGSNAFSQEQGFFSDSGEMLPGMNRGMNFYDGDQSGKAILGNAAGDREDDDADEAVFSGKGDDEASGHDKAETINSIGVVAGLEDVVSAKKVLGSLIAINEKLKLRCGKVFFLGGPQTMTEGIKNLLDRLSIRGCAWSMGRQLPADIDVRRLPAWIINAGGREAVMDGVISPEKFINRNGGFVVPQGMQPDRDSGKQQRSVQQEKSVEEGQEMSTF